MKVCSHVVLDRDWSSYERGTRFVVAEIIPCGQFTMADGKTANPVNLRVVFPGQSIQDKFSHRTIPAEYAVEVPREGDQWNVEANQGVRDGTVMAVIDTEVLVEYEMPNGKTYGRIIDLLKPGYRSVPMYNLPAKWKRELLA